MSFSFYSCDCFTVALCFAVLIVSHCFSIVLTILTMLTILCFCLPLFRSFYIFLMLADYLWLFYYFILFLIVCSLFIAVFAIYFSTFLNISHCFWPLHSVSQRFSWFLSNFSLFLTVCHCFSMLLTIFRCFSRFSLFCYFSCLLPVSHCFSMLLPVKEPSSKILLYSAIKSSNRVCWSWKWWSNFHKTNQFSVITVWKTVFGKKKSVPGVWALNWQTWGKVFDTIQDF